MKEIIIDDKKYKIDCNAFTYIKYPTFFKSGIIDDMNSVRNYIVEQTLLVNKYKNEGKTDDEATTLVSQLLSKEIDNFISKITQIAWILIYTADENIESYENWLKNIKKFKITDKWIVEVAEFAVSTFVDDKLKKEIDKLGDSEDSGKTTFPESSFLSSCLRIGLTLNDLKKLTYVEVMKTMISYLDFKKDEKNKKSNVREATQADIDRFLGG